MTTKLIEKKLNFSLDFLNQDKDNSCTHISFSRISLAKKPLTQDSVNLILNQLERKIAKKLGVTDFIKPQISSQNINSLNTVFEQIFQKMDLDKNTSWYKSLKNTLPKKMREVLEEFFSNLSGNSNYTTCIFEYTLDSENYW